MLWSDERIVSAVKFSNIAISDIPATKATLLMQEVRDEYEQALAAKINELAMLKAHNANLSMELGRTKQRLFDASN